MGWMVRADNGQSYAFEDLTLDGGGKSFTSGKLFLATVGRNVRLHNVHILTSTGQALDTNGTRGVTIQNCLLSAAGSVVFLGAAEQVFIDGTTFVGAQDAGMMLYSWGGEMIRVTNSRGLNASEAVNGGALRFFVGGDPFGGVQRVYLGNNETVDLGPRPESPDNNSGEQILFETSYDPLQDLDPVFFNGSVLSAGADTVTLQGLQTDYTSAFATDMLVVVTGGRGLGQIRRLVHTDTAQGKITVDRPWGVVPNTTSRVFLVRGHDRIVVHANRIDGRTENVTNTRHYASAGVALGLGVTRAIVVDNQFTDVRNAIGLGSHQTHVNEFQPVYSNFFGRNSIRNTRYGIYLIANKSAGIVPNPGPAYLGNIFYGNTFTDVINFGYGEYSVQGARSFDMNVVEGNGGSNLTRAIDFAVRPGDPPDESIPSIDGSSRSNTVVVGNVFMRGSSTGTEGVRGTPSLGLPALRRNLFSGWAAPYASMPATPILEVPSRPIQLISNPGNTQPLVATIPVWNSGPGSLTWVGSKGVPWLTLSSGGTLAGEHSTGVLRITANPSGLTSGTHVAPVGVRVFVNGALVQERVLQLSFTTGCCSAGTSARFMGITDFINDSGTWKGRYGSQGYWIAGESQPSLPSWALASVGVAPRVWEDPSSQTRALQKSTSSTQRIAASFFHPSSFDIQLNVSGGTRQVSLYALDWNFNRSQRIDVIDASTGTVLDSQVLSGFGGGKYLTWMLSGHVILRITRLSGPDAVISGIFFG
jgi:hypothetical protein